MLKLKIASAAALAASIQNIYTYNICVRSIYVYVYTLSITNCEKCDSILELRVLLYRNIIIIIIK